MKIVDNVYLVPGIVCNVYILVDADGLTLVDTGMPGSHGKVLSYIRRLGKSAQDVKHILLTHSDLDHVGSLAALHSASGAPSYASRVEALAIQQGKASREIKPTGF